MPEPFHLPFKVRDYECDVQGIVNNSVYQNYLEHARHEYLLSRGLSFSELAGRGINLVVTRVELEYKQSLRSGDEFHVTVIPQRLSRVRALFAQSIYRAEGERLILTGNTFWTAVNPQGRPFFPAELDPIFDPL